MTAPHPTPTGRDALVEALKPCPFCGSSAELRPKSGYRCERSGSWIDPKPYCTKCRATAPKQILVSDPEPTELWNTRAALSASESAQPLAVPDGMVLVKPLEWVEHPSDPRLCRAISPLGVYQASEITTPARWSFDPYADRARTEGVVENLEVAKATSQADFERRVRACLLPAAPSPETGR